MKAIFDRTFFKQMIGMVIVTSIIITLFGLAFEKGPTQNISVDVLNLDDSKGNASTAAAIIDGMQRGSTLHIYRMEGLNEADAIQSSLDDLKSGKVEAVIVFGHNFTTDIAAWISVARNGTVLPPSNIILYLDSTNPIASASVQAEVQRTTQGILVLKYHLSQPVRIVPSVVYGEGTSMRDFMAPAIAGLIIFILSLIPTLMSRMGRGGAEGAAAPKTDSLLGVALASFVIGMALSVVILVVLALFGIRMAGDMTAAFTILSLLALSSASLGLLLSVAVKGRPSASMAIFALILYPAILLGGIILPVSAVPDYLMPISYIYPLTYAIDGARLVMLNGFGWEGCWAQVLALIIFAVVCLGIAWWIEGRHMREHV